MEPIKSSTNPRNSSGRQKNSTHDLIDRMSDLPDSILGHILSLLPTKNAVATALLSKRWKFVWMTIHNLDFFHNEDEDEVKYMKFVRFVDRILLFQNAGFLNKFRLVCRPGYAPDASSWISIAITRNVHELSLSAQFDLPISVFSCASLQSLELDGLSKVPATFEVFLPRLESLKLSNVYFQSEEAFEKLISGCPILNSLYYGGSDEDNNEPFEYVISSTSLRRLELCINTIYCVKLNASSLEYLFITGSICMFCVQKNLSYLVEAHLRFFQECSSCDDFIIESFPAFDCAKALFLSSYVMEELCDSTIDLSTMFKRLVKLEIENNCCYTIRLQDFIENSDNLEVLAISQDSDSSGICQKWTTPVEVPRCLSNTLKKVVVNDYEGCRFQCEMIRYILKHGSALEVMQISCFGSDTTKLKLVKEIGKFPRKSPVCEIEFL